MKVADSPPLDRHGRERNEQALNNGYVEPALRTAWRIGHGDGYIGRPCRPEEVFPRRRNFASAYTAGHKVGTWKRGITEA